MRNGLISVILTGFLSVTASAEVKLPALFGDNMVLQRGMPLTIWGTGAPGEAVQLTLGQQTGEAKADAEGNWKIPVKALEVGPAIEMTVKGTNTITVKNILVGEVWICSGQSNMEMSVGGVLNAAEEIKSSADNQIRHFAVEKAVSSTPLKDCKGKWVEAGPDTVGGFTAVGYFFGRQLRKDLHVPIGLIHTSWGGTPAEAWTSAKALGAVPELSYLNQLAADQIAAFPAQQAAYEVDLAKWQKEFDAAKAEEERIRLEIEREVKSVGKTDDAKPADGDASELDDKPKPAAATKPSNLSSAEILKAKPQAPGSPENAWTPAALYNAMLNPIVGYGIQGAIWYQGESNAPRAYEYRQLMPTLIADWRSAWEPKRDFTFLIVQLANFTNATTQPVDSSWSELREAQFMTTQALPNVGIGTAIDIGDAGDIHPKNKQEVGRRLALSAEVIAYGMKEVENSGPVYKSMAVEGDSIRLSYTHIGGGLVAKDGPSMKGFQIAGEDKVWVWGDAKIDGETVVVRSDAVAKPVAVRYAWADNPPSTLYNRAGLPAMPFRTDSWPGQTDANKRK